jgi:hypothetical protein
LLFKGPGSFKKSFKKCGNVENLKAYRLIPPMTPLFNGWTIPLSRRYGDSPNCGGYSIGSFLKQKGWRRRKEWARI